MNRIALCSSQIRITIMDIFTRIVIWVMHKIDKLVINVTYIFPIGIIN